MKNTGSKIRASEEKETERTKTERLTALVKKRDKLHEHIPTGKGSYKLGRALIGKEDQAYRVQKQINTYFKKKR